MSGTINTEKLAEFERLIHIRNKIDELTNKGKVFVAVEDFAFARGFRAHQLGGLGYMVRLFLYEKGIPFVIVGTQQLKKFITGHAGAEKNTVVLHVFRRWEWEAKDDNEADATGLAHVGMCLCGLEKPTMVAQREVLDRLMHVVHKRKKGPKRVVI